MKNILVTTAILAGSVGLLSLPLKAACPKKLYFDQLLPVFQGLEINVGNERLIKSASPKDSEIKKDMTSAYYPAYFIWADLVSGNGKNCDYNFRMGLTRITASKKPFKMTIVETPLAMTYDEALKLLKIQPPINKNVIQLKLKSLINQFHQDPDKTEEKIAQFNKMNNAFAIIYSKLGMDYQNFREELAKKAVEEEAGK